jgi:hypothetical protein
MMVLKGFGSTRFHTRARARAHTDTLGVTRRGETHCHRHLTLQPTAPDANKYITPLQKAKAKKSNRVPN